MGHALALVHALGARDVCLQDIDARALDGASGLIDAAFTTLSETGDVDPLDCQKALKRIRYTSELSDAVGNADLVIETVVEKPEIKRQVFAAIDEFAPASAIIASNTSYLDIFSLVPEARQQRTLIVHWYTPPYIIDLVDIAPGPSTKPEIVTVMHDLYVAFGKKPLMFEKLIPGYIANRLQSALNLECFRMIDEGWVRAEDIDYSIFHGLVLRLAVLGHMKKADFTGLEMVQNALASRMYQPPEEKGESAILSRLIAEGRTGVRAGAGFYDYPDSSPETLFKDRDRKLLKVKADLRHLNDRGPR